MKRKRTRPGSAYDRGVRVSITVAPKVSVMIDELLATGLFGFNRAEVFQRLVYRSLQDPVMVNWSPTIRRQMRQLRYRVRKFAAASHVDPAVMRRGRRAG